MTKDSGKNMCLNPLMTLKVEQKQEGSPEPFGVELPRASLLLFCGSRFNFMCWHWGHPQPIKANSTDNNAQKNSFFRTKHWAEDKSVESLFRGSPLPFFGRVSQNSHTSPIWGLYSSSWWTWPCAPRTRGKANLFCGLTSGNLSFLTNMPWEGGTLTWEPVWNSVFHPHLQ